jgi:uncharacterized integral membrane protein
MSERSKPVVVVAAWLFVVYTLGWFANWIARHHDTGQEVIGIVEMTVLGLIAAVAMFRWAQRWPLGDAAARLLLAVLVGCVVSVVVSPFAGGSYPFKAGAGDFFLKVWIFLGASLVGMLLGYIVAVAAGRDYRTRALRRLEESRRSVGAKPRATRTARSDARDRTAARAKATSRAKSGTGR